MDSSLMGCLGSDWESGNQVKTYGGNFSGSLGRLLERGAGALGFSERPEVVCF